MITLKDEAVAGSLAGLCASIVQEIYAVIMKTTGLARYSYGDFAFGLVNSSKMEGAVQIFVGILANMAVGIFLGLIFVYLIKVISARYILLKGFFYGWVVWMLLTGFGSVFRLPAFMEVSAFESLITLGGSILWGVLNAYLLKKIELKGLL